MKTIVMTMMASAIAHAGLMVEISGYDDEHDEIRASVQHLVETGVLPKGSVMMPEARVSHFVYVPTPTPTTIHDLLQAGLDVAEYSHFEATNGARYYMVAGHYKYALLRRLKESAPQITVAGEGPADVVILRVPIYHEQLEKTDRLVHTLIQEIFACDMHFSGSAELPTCQQELKRD